MKTTMEPLNIIKLIHQVSQCLANRSLGKLKNWLIINTYLFWFFALISEYMSMAGLHLSVKNLCQGVPLKVVCGLLLAKKFFFFNYNLY